jgi:serine/threonine protein kinase
MITERLGWERYRVDRLVGVGAMGTVHLARDTVLDRVVAVKVLADHLAADEAFRRRFVQEARLAARLCHPNVVQVFDAGEDEGRPFLVMEYVAGETVADRLARHGPFGPAELVVLATQLSAGLAHAHAAGIVHRDVKPHNVLLRPDGVAKLTDFGIARAVEEHGLTEVGTVLGTAAFMAPEQATGGPVGPAADVYALGALLRHAAAGSLPPGLAAVVDAALAPDPSARPTAADVHRRLLAPAAEAAPTEIRAEHGTELLPPSEPSSVPDRWRPPAAPLIAAGVLIAVLALTMHLRGSGAGPAAGPGATPPATAAAVPAAADPAQAAHNLADWLRSQAR